MLSREQTTRLSKILGRVNSRLPTADKQRLSRSLNDLKNLLAELPNNRSMEIGETNVRDEVRFIANNMSATVNAFEDEDNYMSRKQILETTKSVRKRSKNLVKLVKKEREKYEHDKKYMQTGENNKNKVTLSDEQKKRQKELDRYNKNRREVLGIDDQENDQLDQLDQLDHLSEENDSDHKTEEDKSVLGYSIEKSLLNTQAILEQYLGQKKEVQNVELDKDKIKILQMGIVSFTKPGRFSSAKLDKLEFKTYPLYPGYLFDDQYVIAFYRQTERETALEIARQQLGADMVDVLVGDTVTTDKVSNLNFIWLVSKETYDTLGGFTAIKASFAFDLLQKNQIRNEVKKSSDLSKKRHIFRSEVDKRSERHWTQKDRLNRQISNLDEQLSTKRAEFSRLQQANDRLEIDIKHNASKNNLDSLKMQLKEVDRRKSRLNYQIEEIKQKKRSKKISLDLINQSISNIENRVREELRNLDLDDFGYNKYDRDARDAKYAEQETSDTEEYREENDLDFLLSRGNK